MGLSLKSIGKRIEGLGAQINPFDNGATYNTVLQNRPVAPAPSVIHQITNPVTRLANNVVHPSQLYNPIIAPVGNSPLINIPKIFAANLTGNVEARGNAERRLKLGNEEAAARLRDPNFIANIGAGGHSGPKLAKLEKPPALPKVSLKTSPTPVKVTPKPEGQGANLTPAKTGVVQQVKQGLVDKDQVILDELRNIEKQTGQKDVVKKFMYNSNMTRGSNAIANQTITRSPNLQTAIGGLSKKDYADFSNYANARTELSTAGNKAPTSRPVAELQAVVDAGAHHGARFDALNAHYKELADVAHKAGLIDTPTFERYTANNDYVRLQRDMGDKLPNEFGGGKGYSLGRTVMKQKRTGSQREALPVGETAAQYTQQIYREAARNRTGIHLADTLHGSGLANKLVDASDVLIRRDMYKFLSETKPGKVLVDKLLSRTKASTRGLESELNTLNKRGLNLSLKKNNEGVPDLVIGGLGGKVSTSKAGKVLPMAKEEKAILKAQGIKNDEVATYASKLGPADTRALVQSLVSKDPSELVKIKNMISHREPRLNALLDEVAKLQDESAAFNKARGDAFQTARAHADEVTKNKNTISVLRNGVKEVYEVAPEMKQAFQNINPYHMNAVMQILSVPGRVLRAGVTGLNPVFIARNLIKDQAGSAINSSHTLATHSPGNFFRGLGEASSDAFGGPNSQLWQDFLKHYGDTTSYDLTRNVKDTKKIVNAVRGGRKVRLAQAAKNPLRSLENVAQITEKSTRFQNYVGEYKKAISDGLSKEAASEKAAIAAWQNSVDFSRAGEWGRVINTVIPYWNPATQGVRQMGRTLHNHPIKSPLVGATILGVPLATATAYNLSNSDTKAVYDNISENEKDNNIVLVPPGTKQNQDGTYDVIKIPLPPGYKDVFMPIRRAMEAYHKDQPLAFNRIAQDVLQATTGPVQTQTASQAFGSITPQAIKPFVQQSANKDFFTNKPIVPEYMQNATDAQGNPVPASKMAYKDSSGTARLIGQATNRSPIKVEKFIKDTGGTVGLNVLNATDRALAKAGVTSKNEIGGQSISTGFKKSFAQTQGIENANKSAGAKYYDNLKVAQKGLNGNELSAFNALHPSKKNFLGDTISEVDSTYNPAARLDVYNRFPKVFEADKKLDANNATHNPLFSLQPWQVKKVLEKDNLPPGAKDPELSNLYQQDWYADYSSKKTSFFSDLAGKAAKAGKPFGKQDNPYPVTPPGLQKTMDYYSSLPKGTGARSSWIKSNPGQWLAMQDQFAKVDNWQNIQRGERGLDQTEGNVGKLAGYGSSSGSGGYGSGKDPSYGTNNPYKYAISLKAGGSAPRVAKKVSAGSIRKSRVAARTSKPKVSIVKSRV